VLQPGEALLRLRSARHQAARRREALRRELDVVLDAGPVVEHPADAEAQHDEEHDRAERHVELLLATARAQPGDQVGELVPHSSISVVRENRSWLFCTFVTGEVNCAFLKCGDFSSSGTKSDAERAKPSSSMRSLRTRNVVKYASAGITSVS